MRNLKKIIILTAALLSLIACSKRDDIDAPTFVKGQEVTITAGMPGTQARIRSEVESNSINFFWEQTDIGKSVKVTVGDVDATFTVKSISADGRSASFEGVMPASGTEYTVQYPYDAPDLSSQDYSGNCLPKDKMLFVGTGTLNTTVTMLPQYAALKLNLCESSQALAEGDFLISLSVTLRDSVNATVNTYSLANIPDTLKLGDASDPTPIFFVLPTGTYMIEVTGYVNNDSQFNADTIKTTYHNKTLTAGVCLNMAAKEFCLAAGTRITMADGSYKKVEDIVVGDIVRTFDHEAGVISSSQICYTEEQEPQVTLTLKFASGNNLTVVGQHCLLDETTRKYVKVELGNVKSYVGKRFYNAKTRSWDRLTGYENGKTPVKSYAIYSAYHLNVIAENMLTVEDDAYFLLNIYELDENLKADPDQLAADIEQYGLYDIAKERPEFAQYKELMEQLGSRYYNVAKGKGLVTQSMIDYILSFWKDY